MGQLIGKLKGNEAVALVQSEKDAKLRRSFVSAVRPFRYRRFGRYVRSIRSPNTNLHTGDIHAKERKPIFLNLDVSTDRAKKRKRKRSIEHASRTSRNKRTRVRKQTPAETFHGNFNRLLTLDSQVFSSSSPAKLGLLRNAIRKHDRPRPDGGG